VHQHYANIGANMQEFLIFICLL